MFENSIIILARCLGIFKTLKQILQRRTFNTTYVIHTELVVIESWLSPKPHLETGFEMFLKLKNLIFFFFLTIVWKYKTKINSLNIPLNRIQLRLSLHFTLGK